MSGQGSGRGSVRVENPWYGRRYIRRGAAALVAAVALGAGPAAYVNTFDGVPAGKMPEDIMVLDGPFSIADVGGNKCLELAGNPLGAFGALFGPAGVKGAHVKARVWAAPTGRRFPEFGIGANDAGGAKLMALPGQHRIELRAGDETIATAEFTWSPAAWTWLKLRIAQVDGKWLVQGKAWPEGQPEPGAWTISAPAKTEPTPGRASVWGNDFSEQPIRFDDLGVDPLN